MVYLSMSMDEPKASSNSRSCSSHMCVQCELSFASFKALQCHVRIKHVSRSLLNSYVGTSTVCPVCFVPFSNRLRLLAHINEKRKRGKRRLTCNAVLRAGFVKQVSDAEVCIANEEARTLRCKGRKRKLLTAPLMQSAKRVSIRSSLTEHQRDYFALPGENRWSLPSNPFYTESVRPTKRLRTKTSVDSVILQHTS